MAASSRLERDKEYLVKLEENYSFGKPLGNKEYKYSVGIQCGTTGPSDKQGKNNNNNNHKQGKNNNNNNGNQGKNNNNNNRNQGKNNNNNNRKQGKNNNGINDNVPKTLLELPGVYLLKVIDFLSLKDLSLSERVSGEWKRIVENGKIFNVKVSDLWLKLKFMYHYEQDWEGRFTVLVESLSKVNRVKFDIGNVTGENWSNPKYESIVKEAGKQEDGITGCNSDYYEIIKSAITGSELWESIFQHSYGMEAIITLIWRDCFVYKAAHCLLLNLGNTEKFRMALWSIYMFFFANSHLVKLDIDLKSLIMVTTVYDSLVTDVYKKTVVARKKLSELNDMVIDLQDSLNVEWCDTESGIQDTLVENDSYIYSFYRVTKDSALLIAVAAQISKLEESMVDIEDLQFDVSGIEDTLVQMLKYFRSSYDKTMEISKTCKDKRWYILDTLGCLVLRAIDDSYFGLGAIDQTHKHFGNFLSYWQVALVKESRQTMDLLVHGWSVKMPLLITVGRFNIKNISVVFENMMDIVKFIIFKQKINKVIGESTGEVTYGTNNLVKKWKYTYKIYIPSIYDYMVDYKFLYEKNQLKMRLFNEIGKNYNSFGYLSIRFWSPPKTVKFFDYSVKFKKATGKEKSAIELVSCDQEFDTIQQKLF